MEAGQANITQRYAGLLVRRGWLILFSALIASAFSFGYNLRREPVYQASTTIFIDTAPGTGSNADYNSLLTSERQARTYAQLLETQPLLQAVIDQLTLPFSIEELGRSIDVRTVRDTQLINVQVRDTDPARAAAIANTLVRTFAQQIQQRQTTRYSASKDSLQQQMTLLEDQIKHGEEGLAALAPDDPGNAPERERETTSLDQYRQSYANLVQSYEQVRLAEAQATSGVIPVEPAAVPDRSVSPRLVTNTALAAILGLLLAFGLVVLSDIFDDRFRDHEELSRITGLPILGLIERTRSAGQSKLIVAEQPRSAQAEAYRGLRTNLQFASVTQPVHSILVTSAIPNEGKSEVVVNLAVALAQNGLKVILVDADLRRPLLHTWLNVNVEQGLSELFLQTEADAVAQLVETQISGVMLLGAGSAPPNPAELVGSARMGQIVQQLEAQADIVLIDAPPVIAVTDAVAMTQYVGGVLLVVRQGVSKRAACREAVTRLRHVGARVFGVVVNDARARLQFEHAYREYYEDIRPNGHVVAAAPIASGAEMADPQPSEREVGAVT